MNSKITQEHLQDLLGIFAKKSYEAGSCEAGTTEYDIIKRCEELLKLDYGLITLDNQNGVLSPQYPSRIFIPEYETHCGNNFLTVGTTLSGTLIQQNQQQQQQQLQKENFQYHRQQHEQQQQQQQQQQCNQNIHEDLYDTGKLRDLITMAKYARCRQRFVIPVILFNGKFICRSATISVMPEIYGRKVVDYAYGCINGINNATTTMQTTNNIDVVDNHDVIEDSLMAQTAESSPFSYHEIIKSDIELLRTLKVSTIFDLMVEQRKMKYFMPVSSSEKADPENQYSSFNLLSLPYPGCEFFSKFRDNNYMAKNLYYNWTQSFIDATLNVPKYTNNHNHQYHHSHHCRNRFDNNGSGCGDAGGVDVSLNSILSSSSSSSSSSSASSLPSSSGSCSDNNDDDDNINWNDYKKWDLVLITQNYLKAILKFIKDDKINSGVLIHCISGWDRTPLFISLIRLSLWADGLIHQSLNPFQIAYFTLAYDWYLFGHHLPDRLSRGEEILFFCFHVLKHITEDEFSVTEQRRRTKTSNSSGSSVIVLKTDCCDDEPSSSREDCVLVQNLDQDSNDSFSNCDMSSNENFCINNCRSPYPKRSKTSPISVPGASACRQRNESTSSNGSWQVVTETGSIDSIMNNESYMKFVQQENTTNGSNILNNDNSLKPSSSLRKQRLNAVRAVFIQSYGKTIGLKFKEGSSINLVTFIGTIADQLF